MLLLLTDSKIPPILASLPLQEETLQCVWMLHDLLSHLSGITLCKWKAGWLSWPGVSGREAPMYLLPHVKAPLEKWRLGRGQKRRAHEPEKYPIHPTDAHVLMLSCIDLIVTHNFIRASMTVFISQIMLVFEHENKVTVYLLKASVCSQNFTCLQSQLIKSFWLLGQTKISP